LVACPKRLGNDGWRDSHAKYRLDECGESTGRFETSQSAFDPLNGNDAADTPGPAYPVFRLFPAKGRASAGVCENDAEGPGIF
jgi:hypothetical protein